ncbi:MAG: glycosyltransferase family 10 [Gammaproteobacteria bacterium]
MIAVKVSTPFPEWPLVRQTPGGEGVWGECRFVVNQPVDACDYWVVCEGLTEEQETRCPRENTILVTWEPPDIKTYAQGFLDQFGTIVTCHREIRHPHIVYRQQGLPWMTGARLDPGSHTWTDHKTFEQIAADPGEKTKLLSVVASSKTSTPGHRARERLLSALEASLGTALDIFGLGYRPIEDKWDAVAPYRYHLAIENTAMPDYWTEKLADAFLGQALPIYAGCTNVLDYFPERSLVLIDPASAENAIRKIMSVLEADPYAERADAIRFAKEKVLREYNLFAMLERLLKATAKHPASVMERVTLFPEQRFNQSKVRRRSLHEAFTALVTRFGR